MLTEDRIVYRSERGAEKTVVCDHETFCQAFIDLKPTKYKIVQPFASIVGTLIKKDGIGCAGDAVTAGGHVSNYWHPKHWNVRPELKEVLTEKGAGKGYFRLRIECSENEFLYFQYTFGLTDEGWMSEYRVTYKGDFAYLFPNCEIQDF